MIKLNFSSAEHAPLEAILPVDNPRIHLFRRRSGLLVISWFKPNFLTRSLGIKSLCSIEPTAKEDVFLLHVSKCSTFPSRNKLSTAWYPGLIWNQTVLGHRLTHSFSTKKCFCATFSTCMAWKIEILLNNPLTVSEEYFHPILFDCLVPSFQVVWDSGVGEGGDEGVLNR